ncbi:hypothetical protein T07_14302, partial [Trichinella nelsoni]
SRRWRFSSLTAKIYNIGIDNIYCQKQTGFLVYNKKCKGVNGSTAASRSGKSLEIFVQMFLNNFGCGVDPLAGCPAPLYPTTVLLFGPPASQPRILPA